MNEMLSLCPILNCDTTRLLPEKPTVAHALQRFLSGPAARGTTRNALSERRSSVTRASVTRPSITQGASLAATPRPAGAKTAGDRVTMIARLACWGAIFGYIAVLTLRLLILYGG